jgi:hypothetical protein
MKQQCVIVGIKTAKRVAWALSKARNRWYFVYELSEGKFLVSELETEGLKLRHKVKSRVAVDVE